ncbi:hypothetical protein FOB58_005574 [Candida parapsilosis]|uniref:Uncharacterized protein n=2 Tax=Candida parapsilosis TaxID=5480 RepID=G8BKR5_CANPC|nr:uncharacterized protein CPAR2_703440 [Candida parapsilosis]KAF6042091.1 hypothetical protein FOB58_005574 [Candida parapsilosis]KAF6042370.1 hypothetical protein FOB59_005552 [Candida parapsilosis]KAF6042815.1 hypothetical protein FOB60_005569 [Candida parapsilosis]KAF6058176.1 hypothetical protein FOB61_005765 [Candida parapsilosis]CCE45331.1 hypothetical protein CPAR2_703440 [Candida parapsilosis]
MLQQNQISNLLKSALSSPGSTTTSSTPSVPNFHPISISLLSNHGNPLISLTTKSQSTERVDHHQSQSQSQPQSQLHSLHSSKAGTPTTTTMPTVTGEEYDHARATPSVYTGGNADSQDGTSFITLDQLKIYSLIAYNTITEATDSDESSSDTDDANDWSIVDFGTVKCIISKVNLDQNPSRQKDNRGAKQLKDNGQDIKRSGENNTKSTTNDDKDAEFDNAYEDYDVDLFNGYFVVLFYQSGNLSTTTATAATAATAREERDLSSFDFEVDAIAKIKTDSVVNALGQGLKGYHEPITN